MSVKPPPRWTSRSLTAMLLPHLFRKARNHAEAIGPVKERVPLDAHENHMFIKRREAAMVKAIRSQSRLTFDRPQEEPKNHLWSIATGEWVPEYLLKLHYIFPFSLGPMVAEQVSTRITWRGSNNGLLIPTAVGRALNDWALVITPHKNWRQAKTPRSYLFTRLESDTRSLRDPLRPGSSLAVRDLDGEPLHLRSKHAPNPHSCYFQSCCAMWKSTFLEQPDRRAEDFWERFQFRMDDLWGSRMDRQKILDIFKPPELLTSEEIEKSREREAKVKDEVSSTDDEPGAGQTEREDLAVDGKPETSN
ncbi:hypothetical protein INS49_009366 [Diaporthe citri]|uniref:uncharacterized protein n=1 Tax=Diaporthe citri TaxID=83186 RepID=UPI001C7EBC23|nr:uncharacterized protein INS49_009366 [Diaporthe citri]KAG6361142.1 hypothetical protein INS49_009366 [Diaporthe citri]